MRLTNTAVYGRVHLENGPFQVENYLTPSKQNVPPSQAYYTNTPRSRLLPSDSTSGGLGL